MFHLSDTIAAICTPSGKGGIAAIRISGENAWEISGKIFYLKKNDKATYSNFEHMQALHGFIKDKDLILDEVVLLPYQAPNSFTSENTVEIFCHGGIKIPAMILDLCLFNGARLAGPGEFTFRAFVNGRIDLTEAEAVNELINADSKKAVLSAGEVLSGSLKSKVKDFRSKLYEILATMESSIEFPMDVPEVNNEKLILIVSQIKKDLDLLIEKSGDGKILKDGIKVSIIGPPNTGKSSLLNVLLESDRAIVTSQPGTTRDTLEEKLSIEGMPILLIDTAGIRDVNEKDDPEFIGIQKTKQIFEKSDFIIFLFDLSCLKSDEMLETFLKEVNGKPKILVGNKIDLIENKNNLQDKKFDILISAKCGTNIDNLKKLIISKFKDMNLSSKNQETFINERQRSLLLQCSSVLDFVISSALDGAPEDIVSDELKKAISKLDEISGAKVNDEIISQVFSKFCIGK